MLSVSQRILKWRMSSLCKLSCAKYSSGSPFEGETKDNLDKLDKAKVHLEPEDINKLAIALLNFSAKQADAEKKAQIIRNEHPEQLDTLKRSLEELEKQGITAGDVVQALELLRSKRSQEDNDEAH